MSIICFKNTKCGLLAGLFLLCGALADHLHAAGTPISWGGLGLTNVPAGLRNRVVAIACGKEHSLALKDDGTVEGWGANSSGQLNVPAGLRDIKAVAGGSYHSLALRTNGTVVVWGDQTTLPTALSNINTFKAIAAGEFHNLGLTTSGQVWEWDNYGRVYNRGTGFKAIASGASHGLAVANGGTVSAWGGNAYGQANVPANLTGVTMVAAGSEFSIAMRSDGSIVGWGNNQLNQYWPMPFTSGASMIAAGEAHCMAIRSGKVHSWGVNTLGVTNVPANLQNPISIAAGANHCVALVNEPVVILTNPQPATVMAGGSANFTVSVTGSTPLTYQWRLNGNSIAGATNASYTLANAASNNAGNISVIISNPVGSVTSTNALLTVNYAPSILMHPQNVDVGEGTNVSLSVSASGSTPLMYRWYKNGTNLFAAVNSILDLPHIQLSASGTYYVVVSNAYGTATSFGAVVTVHPLPKITQHPQSQTVSLGSAVTFMGSAIDATSLQWSKNSNLIPGASNSVYIINRAEMTDSGNYAMIARNPYGSVTSTAAGLVITAVSPTSTNVVVWGENPMFVDPDYVRMDPPADIDDAVAIAAGEQHHLALRRDGTVVGWGANNYAQAGRRVTNATMIAAGGYHSLALLATGALVAWGRDIEGQLSVPSNLSNVVAIAAGGYHNLALGDDGRITAWGFNQHGQSSVPPNVSNVVAIAAGWEHSLALLADGSVIGWGDNSMGQARIPAKLGKVKAIAAGYYHTVAILTNGEVAAWGANIFGQSTVPPGLKNVIAVAGGANHCLALLSDGTVRAWGQDNWGQVEVPEDLNGVFGIAAAGSRSVAVKRKPLKMQRPIVSGNQKLMIVRHQDDSAIEPERIGRMAVYASTNLTMPLSNWYKLPTVLTNDGFYGVDGSTQLPHRFYRTIENP